MQMTSVVWQRGERMAEYIVIEVATEEDGVYADLRKPLIRCRDCKHHKGYNCDRLYGMQDAFMDVRSVKASPIPWLWRIPNDHTS